MNLRIAPEHIRFRISEAELAHLHQQAELTHGTHVSNLLNFEYTLQLETPADCIAPALLRLQTQQEAQGIHLVLTIAHDAIGVLCSPEKAQDRIRECVAFDNGSLLTIDLEVDLHSKRGV